MISSNPKQINLLIMNNQVNNRTWKYGILVTVILLFLFLFSFYLGAILTQYLEFIETNKEVIDEYELYDVDETTYRWLKDYTKYTLVLLVSLFLVAFNVFFDLYFIRKVQKLWQMILIIFIVLFVSTIVTYIFAPKIKSTKIYPTEMINKGLNNIIKKHYYTIKQVIIFSSSMEPYDPYLKETINRYNETFHMQMDEEFGIIIEIDTVPRNGRSDKEIIDSLGIDENQIKLPIILFNGSEVVDTDTCAYYTYEIRPLSPKRIVSIVRKVEGKPIIRETLIVYPNNSSLIAKAESGHDTRHEYSIETFSQKCLFLFSAGILQGLIHKHNESIKYFEKLEDYINDSIDIYQDNCKIVETTFANSELTLCELYASMTWAYYQDVMESKEENNIFDRQKAKKSIMHINQALEIGNDKEHTKLKLAILFEYINCIPADDYEDLIFFTKDFCETLQVYRSNYDYSIQSQSDESDVQYPFYKIGFFIQMCDRINESPYLASP